MNECMHRYVWGNGTSGEGTFQVPFLLYYHSTQSRFNSGLG